MLLTLPLLWMCAALVAPQESTAMARATEARGITAAPPHSPAQHYLFSGEITFHIGERKPVTQGVQILLGGPDRLRFTLTAKELSNIFLYMGPTTPKGKAESWVKTPKAKQARENPVGTIDRDTWLRWAVARFPWGWSFPTRMDGSKTTAPADQSDIGPVYAEIHGPSGIVRAKLRNWLPAHISADNLELYLTSWKKTPTGSFPQTWAWHYPHGKQIEQFSEMRGGMLCLKNAFLPAHLTKTDAGSWVGLRTSAEAPISGSRDKIEKVLQPDLYWVVDDGGITVDASHKWVRVENEKSTQARLVEAGTPGAKMEKGGTYLKWSIFGSNQPILDAKRFIEAAEFNHMQAIGPVWMTGAPDDDRAHHRVLLVRIRD